MAEQLTRRRVRIRHRRYACRMGEIDLVLETPETIVMVEVRYRQRLTRAVESVDRHKRRRLRACAQFWLANNPTDKPVRFDTVGVCGGAPAFRCRWITNAFEMDD